MIELRDTVAIDVAPQVVWSWLESMPDHYPKWHPDHLRYQVFPGLSGEFEVRPVNAGSEFTAVIALGVRAPIVGPVADWLLRRTLGTRIDAIRRHQAEEGANLKVLLERVGSQ